MKNKKVVIAVAAVLILAILGVTGFILFGRSSQKDEETTRSVSDTEQEEVTVDGSEEETIAGEQKEDATDGESEKETVVDGTEEDAAGVESDDNSDALELIGYEIVNPKRLNLSDEDKWILIRFDENKAAMTGSAPTNDRIAEIDDSLASQIYGYEYGFILGYYHNDVFYTSIISDKVLIIKKIDFKNETLSYDEYINMPMPEGYELSGLWEGERLNNDDYPMILDMDDDKIYFHVIGEEFTEDIYLLDLDDMSITKLDSSPRYGPHSRTRAYKYDKYLILKEDTGYYLIDKSIGADFEVVLALEAYIGGYVGEPSIKDRELYFSFDNVEYNNPDSPNESTEIHKEYKYNFETKTLTELD